MLLSFAAFLRSNELLNLRRCDIEFFSLCMSLFLQSSKTDKYRDGACVPVTRTGTVLCRVDNLEKYLLWAKIANDSDCFLFLQLTKTKKGYRLRETQSSLAYSNLKLFIDAVKPFVKDVKSFCVHSLRSGGATAAANRGIPDRLFKRHGRWSSESAKICQGFHRRTIKSFTMPRYIVMFQVTIYVLNIMYFCLFVCSDIS